MISVGAYEAKTNLARLLDEVEQGRTVTITRHGREVARLVPAEHRWSDTESTIAAIRQARRGIRRGSLSVREMLDEGRR